MLETDWAHSPTGRVIDLLTSRISVVSPEARLSEALHLVTVMNLKVLAVYDGKRYVGFIGHSFLTEVMHTLGVQAGHTRVREFMETTIPPCSPQDLIHEVRTRMRHAGQTDLPVIDEHGKVAGVLSATEGDEPLANMTSDHKLRSSPRPFPWEDGL
jgi:CBS-domain-containing membrane protein